MPEPKSALEQLREAWQRTRQYPSDHSNIRGKKVVKVSDVEEMLRQFQQTLAREQDALICIKDVWTIAAKHIPAGMEDGCSCELCAAVNTECRSREDALRREVIEECITELAAFVVALDNQNQWMAANHVSSAADKLRALAAPTSAGDGPKVELTHGAPPNASPASWCGPDETRIEACPACGEMIAIPGDLSKSLILVSAKPADAGKGGGE